MLRLQRAVASAVAAAAIMGTGLAMTAPASADSRPSFIGRFSELTNISSTIPQNGDQNPYGVAVVRHSRGRLIRGDVLISNFNDMANQQGTGSTIVQVSPSGQQTLFAQITTADVANVGGCPGGIGLTTALVILRDGWVVVGSTPSQNGMVATSGPGCLIVLDNHGNVRETISGHGINGPWDMTAFSDDRFAELFVTNVLNGVVKNGVPNPNPVHKGTVLRLLVKVHRDRPPDLLRVTKIGSGFFEQASATAFVVGPTGLGLGRDGTLYVADTGENRITGIRDAVDRDKSAGTGFVLTSGNKLNGPLGLAVAPNGDVLTVNGGDGLIVETTPRGRQIASFLLNNTGTPAGNGALFGVAVAPHGKGVYFVDDDINFLRLLH